LSLFAINNPATIETYSFDCRIDSFNRYVSFDCVSRGRFDSFNGDFIFRSVKADRTVTVTLAVSALVPGSVSRGKFDSFCTVYCTYGTLGGDAELKTTSERCPGLSVHPPGKSRAQRDETTRVELIIPAASHYSFRSEGR
jgi:hypothetical protein